MVGRAETGKGHGEGRVAPALGDPRAVAQHAQGAQRLDEQQLRVVELHEILVAAQQGVQLPASVLPFVSVQEQPEVLHGRAAASVVEVDQVQRLFALQQVAAVGIAMQALKGGPCALEGPGHALHRGAGGVLPARGLGRVHHLQGQQRVDGLDAQRRRERQAVGEALLRAHGVDAADQPAQALESLGGFDVRVAPTQPGTHADPVRIAALGVPVQQGVRRAGDPGASRGWRQQAHGQRRHHGHFGRGELQGEAMLFVDLRIAPAPGAVELRHHRATVLQHQAKHPVLVGIELQDAAVAAQADGVQGLEHRVGGQAAVASVGRRGDRVRARGGLGG